MQCSIFHPLARDDPTSPLILFLPTAPHAAETSGVQDEKIIATLSAASNATIVRVNYRADDGVRYPTPVHDVLAGYDYVKERFALDSCTTRSGRVKKAQLKMGVCGQLVGGSLAAMLGLTESHLAQDRIAAMAINCPITDWLFPEQQMSIEDALGNNAEDTNGHISEKTVRKKRTRKANLPSWEAYNEEPDNLHTRDLYDLREVLFSKPANYFDPFASPIHFFRSPSVNVPVDPTLINEDEDPLSALLPHPKPRKAHRTFPPSNSTLILPSIRLSTGLNPLADSNEEFVKVLRRSVMRRALGRANVQAQLDRFEEEVVGEDERVEGAIGEAERRVEYHVARDGGLWGTEGEGWMEEVERVGAWFRRVLG